MEKTERTPSVRKKKTNALMGFTAVLCALVLLLTGFGIYLLVRVSRLEKQLNGEEPPQGITDYIDEKNEEMKSEIEQEQQNFAGDVSKIIHDLANKAGVTLTDE